MPDIATVWNPAAGHGDWVIAGPDLLSGQDLETSVIISLFTDARASADDIIPDGTGNPRGWWGDTNWPRPLGSKLWLLERAKQTEQTRQRAQDYIEAALAWLIEDGIAASVSVVTQWQGRGFLAAAVTIAEPDGRTSAFNYQWAWGDVASGSGS